MKLDIGHGLFQKQSLVVSAKALQSLAVLQFSQQELHDYLHEEAERNPFIEIADSTGKMSGGGTLASHERAFANAPGVHADFDAVAALCDAPCSLHDHMRAQMRMTFRDRTELAIASEIVEAIDGDGYLRRDMGELAQTLGAEPQVVAHVLSVVQGFDPIGVGARDLAECLSIQLAERGKRDPRMVILLANLDLLAGRDYDKLGRLCGVDPVAITAMVQDLRACDPKPGRRFDTDMPPPAVPDIVVTRTADNGFALELTAQCLPKVLVDKAYCAQLRGAGQAEPHRRFVTDNLQNANWLVRNLEQRATTILKVATEIVAQQAGFLEHGISHLRPLQLQDVALAVGVHESTVCRAIANKYMMTSRGMFELKFFFANGLSASNGGDDHATESVRHRIRQLVAGETAKDVLSDDGLVTALRDEGIDIARRTVAKYREMMSIPSSLQRRKQLQFTARAQAMSEGQRALR